VLAARKANGGRPMRLHEHREAGPPHRAKGGLTSFRGADDPVNEVDAEQKFGRELGADQWLKSDWAF
jgi:hypothetical protein